MIIAPHHRPGAHMASDTDYVPACAWPEKCYVQWGDLGFVLSKDKETRTTAFFEAFPADNAGSFIRGEGATIAEAEASAFAKWSRQVGCEHRWGRQGYANGGALCYGCRAFRKLFQEIHVFGDWRRPLSRMEDSCLNLPPVDEEGRRYRRKLLLRKKVFGVEPPREFGSGTEMIRAFFGHDGGGDGNADKKGTTR